MRTRGLMAASAMCLLLGAGCSSGEKPTTLPAVTHAATSGSSTSGSTTTTTTPTSRGTSSSTARPGASAPTSQPSDAIRAVAETWYGLVEQSYKRLDPRPMERLSGPDCRGCRGHAASIATYRSKGQSVIGGRYTTKVVKVEVLSSRDGGAIIDVAYSGGAVVDRKGATVERMPAVKARQQLVVGRVPSGWAVLEILDVAA